MFCTTSVVDDISKHSKLHLGFGESHSGDTETLWYDGYRFIRSRARSAFGNYSLPIRFNCLFELGAGVLEGLIGLPA